MNSYIYLVGLVIVVILLVVLIKKYDEPYVMNLGNYGKEVPSICYEVAPVDSVCRACSLSCPDPVNCNECKQRTMCVETEPVKDTAGYPAVCNACHVSCRNPDECFECRRKLVLPGVL
jgi:hypothetical protein